MTGNLKNCFIGRTFACIVVCCLAFSCSQKMDPKTADLEVRKLLKDAPGFDWSPGPASRMAYLNDSELPAPPKDDEDSRLVTERIQKGGAFADGNASAHFKEMDCEAIKEVSL